MLTENPNGIPLFNMMFNILIENPDWNSNFHGSESSGTSPSSRPMKRLALKMVRSGERPLNVSQWRIWLLYVIVIPYYL